MKYFRKYISIVLTLTMLIGVINFGTLAVSDDFIESGVKLSSGFVLNSDLVVKDGVIFFTKIASQNENELVKEIVYVVPKEDISAKSLSESILSTAQNKASGDSSITVREYDISVSIEGWVKVRYSKGTSSWGPTAKVTAVSGGYSKLDGSVSVTSQHVMFGGAGKNASTGRVIGENSEKYPTSTSWSYSAPSTWHYIVRNGAHAIGAYCDFSLKRSGGSTWTFTIDCYVSQG